MVEHDLAKVETGVRFPLPAPMNIIQIMTVVAGIAMSFGYYPQAYKIWRLKSAKEISLLNYSITSIGTPIWLIYGIALQDPVLITSFSISVIGTWLVLLLTIRYR